MFNWLLSQKLDRIGRRANPDRAFVVALEKQLKGRMRRPSRFAFWKVGMSSFASLALLFTGTGAYAYSSDAVLPDHPLYPVRDVIERTEDRLTVTEAQRANVRLKHVRRRLKEQAIIQRLQKPVTREQAQRFATKLEAAIDASDSLSEEEREKIDRRIANAERAYAALLKSREQTTIRADEKLKIRNIEEERMKRIDARVEKLQERRRVRLQQLLDRQQRPTSTSTGTGADVRVNAEVLPIKAVEPTRVIETSEPEPSPTFRTETELRTRY